MSPMFPLGKTGGLIEAMPYPSRLSISRRVFPLGKTGGLIEALSTAHSSHSIMGSFRWVKPAASLKRIWGGTGAPLGVRVFPLGKTGGLIEAVAKPDLSVQFSRRFPLGKTGGLIEARHLVPRKTSRSGVSAG